MGAILSSNTPLLGGMAARPVLFDDDTHAQEDSDLQGALALGGFDEVLLAGTRRDLVDDRRRNDTGR